MPICFECHLNLMDSVEAFSVLASRTRQDVLKELSATTGNADLYELSQSIAVLDSDASPEEVQCRLAHVDLPTLDAHGLIDYDESSGNVVLSERAEDLQPILNVAAELEA